MANYRFNVGQFDVLMIKDGGAPRAASGWLASAPKEELDQIVRSHGLDPESLDSAITPIVINTGSEQLAADLRRAGYECLSVELDEFIKAGGSAKCLTLRLDGEDAAVWGF